MPAKQVNAAAEMEDKRQQRRRRARRKALVRALVLLVVCGLVFVLWLNWDMLSPDRLVDRVQDLLGSGIGSYPVDISGSHVQHLVKSQNYVVALSDSYLTYYNAAGAQANRYPCSYASGILRTSGRYVLLAEQGGKRVQLNTRTALLTELMVEQDILSVAVNEKGQFAVLTLGPQGYAVQVKVYDRKGEELYARSRNQMATEVALSPDGKQVSLLSVQAEDGSLNTTVDVFSLETQDAAGLCAYTAKDALLYRLDYLADGWLAAVGENGAVLLDTADGLSTVFAPTGMQLLGYAVSEQTLALVLRPYGSTGDGEVQIINKAGEPTCKVPFTGEFRHISGDKRQYLLLTDGYAQWITTTGAFGIAEVPADGQQAVLDGKRAIVLGLSQIEAYDLK